MAVAGVRMSLKGNFAEAAIYSLSMAQAEPLIDALLLGAFLLHACSCLLDQSDPTKTQIRDASVGASTWVIVAILNTHLSLLYTVKFRNRNNGL